LLPANPLLKPKGYVKVFLMRKFFFFLLLGIFLVFPPFVLAKIGVGVGTGKIQVEDKLRPGMIYELPSLTVFNTGDEEGDYEAAITYHEKQPELRPLEEWFGFSPKEFHLKPGEAQEVKIKLNLPVKTEPGDYFAYLEGHPLKKGEGGQTTVGVAAAAKLYFTVLPANLVLGAYYKVTSFWRLNQPWSNRVAVAVAVIIIYLGLKKYLGFQINFRGKKEESSDE
jgi:hypothetical protein